MPRDGVVQTQGHTGTFLSSSEPLTQPSGTLETLSDG